jgi:hypothetical protein
MTDAFIPARHVPESMASEVVTASIPEEQRPLWDRMSQAHGGASKLVQWMLATLGSLEDAPLSEQEQALRRGLARAQVSFLEARIALDQAEVDRLGRFVAPLGAVRVAPRVDAGEWWQNLHARFGGELFQLSERQLRALAERAGADGDACWALILAKREEASQRFEVARP